MRWSRYSVLLVLAGCGVDLSYPDDLRVSCTTSADCGDELVCDGAFCVVRLDTDPPGLVSANTPTTSSIRLVFDEPMREDSVQDSDFAIEPALQLFGATFDNESPTEVLLVTGELTLDATYTITVTAITDVAGNALDPSAARGTVRITAQPDDPSPPDLVSPGQDDVVGFTVGLVWSARQGAESYTLQVAEDAAFTVGLNTYVVAAPDAGREVTVSDSKRFYWRVKSDLSVYTTPRAFEVVGSTIHVFCASTDTCTDARLQTGSKSSPYLLPSRGVTAAQARGATTVKIAARGGAARYDDSLLLSTSVTVSGGYTSAFNDYPEGDCPNPTYLRATTSTLLVSGAVGPLRVNCLELETTSAASEYTVKLTGSSDVDLRRVTASGPSTLIVTPNVIDTVVRDSKFTSTSSKPFVALLQGGVVRASVFVSPWAGTGGQAMNVRDNAVVERSTLVLGNSGSSQSVSAVEVLGAAVLRDNLIVANAAFARAVQLGGPNVIVGNTIVAFVAPDNPGNVYTGVVGMRASSSASEGSGAIITNNLIVSLTSGGRCFAEKAYADPFSFENNVLVGCTSEAYGDYFITETGNPTPNNQPQSTAEQINALDVTDMFGQHRVRDGTSRYNGNIVSAIAVNALFVNYDGADNNLFAYEDNDLHLLLTSDSDGITTAGKVATGNDCGVIEAPVACGGEAVDFAGAARTVPWSAGAYEK